jgi:hypothetical protein
MGDVCGAKRYRDAGRRYTAHRARGDMVPKQLPPAPEVPYRLCSPCPLPIHPYPVPTGTGTQAQGTTGAGAQGAMVRRRRGVGVGVGDNPATYPRYLALHPPFPVPCTPHLVAHPQGIGAIPDQEAVE